ncbi:MAG: hypothetical protein ACRC7O_06070, partial [Fimbriiglobus sp.]
MVAAFRKADYRPVLNARAGLTLKTVKSAGGKSVKRWMKDGSAAPPAPKRTLVIPTARPKSSAPVAKPPTPKQSAKADSKTAAKAVTDKVAGGGKLTVEEHRGLKDHLGKMTVADLKAARVKLGHKVGKSDKKGDHVDALHGHARKGLSEQNKRLVDGKDPRGDSPKAPDPAPPAKADSKPTLPKFTGPVARAVKDSAAAAAKAKSAAADTGRVLTPVPPPRPPEDKQLDGVSKTLRRTGGGPTLPGTDQS